MSEFRSGERVDWVTLSQFMDPGRNGGRDAREGMVQPETAPAMFVCLTCGLCHNLLQKDVVALQVCGHMFCDRCINTAVEHGFEEEDELLLCYRRELGVGPHAAQKISKRGGNAFSCPICRTPAHKWTLTPVPLMASLGSSIQQNDPHFMKKISGAIREENTLSPPTSNNAVMQCSPLRLASSSCVMGSNSLPRGDVTRFVAPLQSVDLFARPETEEEVAVSKGVLVSPSITPSSSGADGTPLPTEASSVLLGGSLRHSATPVSPHEEWTPRLEKNDKRCREEDFEEKAAVHFGPSTEPSSSPRTWILLDYSVSTDLEGILQRAESLGITVVDERDGPRAVGEASHVKRARSDCIGPAIRLQPCSWDTALRHAVLALGRMEPIPASADVRSESGGFCLTSLSPVVCTALAQGGWCLDATWLMNGAAAMEKSRSLSDHNVTALRSPYAALTWKQGINAPCLSEAHNAFAAFLMEESEAEGQRRGVGKWISRQGYAFTVLPDAWVQRVLVLLYLLLSLESVLSVSLDRALEWLKVLGGGSSQLIEWSGNTAGFSHLSWARLVACLGGHLLEVSLSLWNAVLVYVLSGPLWLTSESMSDSDTLYSPKLMASVESEVLSVMERLAPHPESAPGFVLHSPEGCSPVLQPLLLLHTPLTKRFLASCATLSEMNSLASEGAWSNERLRAARQHLPKVMEKIAKCLQVLAMQAASRSGLKGEWKPQPNRTDVRSTTWLLTNLAEGRAEAGVKLSVPSVTGLPALPVVVLNQPVAEPDTEMTTQSTDISDFVEFRSTTALRSLLYEDTP